MSDFQHDGAAADTDETWTPDRAMLGLAALEGLMVPGKEGLTDFALDAETPGDGIEQWINLAELFTELLVFVVDLEAGERELPVETYLQSIRERILRNQGEGMLFARY